VTATYHHPTMITADVDLSSQAARTAACVIDWSEHRATVTELAIGVDDDTIAGLIAKVAKLGIDVSGPPAPTSSSCQGALQ
jgi:hypothetical protein